MKLLEKVRKAVERHRMLENGDGVVVAVSGGPDSVALLGLLQQLSVTYNLSLVVAHLNHGLRPGPADEDEAFVHRLSARLGLACESRRIDVAALSRMRKTSLEETAREERYRFLEDIRFRYGARKIAMGHHAGDQAETVLMNLLRGGASVALRGMQAVRDERFIRPLLGVTREEITSYLAWQGLPHRIDLSNEDEHHFRNRVRHRLIPELKTRYNPRMEECLCRMAEILRLEDDYLNQKIAACMVDCRLLDFDAPQGEIRVSIPLFLGLHEAIQGRLIMQLLLTYSRRRQGFGYAHVRDVKALMQADHSGGSLHLPFGTEVRREYDVLVIGRRTGPPRVAKTVAPFQRGHSSVQPDGWIAFDIAIPGEVQVDGRNMTLSLDFVEREAVCLGDRWTVYMDYGCIVPPLVVRMPRPGDRIQPLGMRGVKKLSRYFIDRKVPARLRAEVPLLVDGRSVIWIVGQALSERVKLTDRSTEILKIAKVEKI